MNPENRNEMLAEDIKAFIMANGLNIDVRIYFNNKCYDWIEGDVYLKEPNLLTDIKPSQYFEYANDDTVAMSFEGDLYDIINYHEMPKVLERFDEIFDRHNCYYELGHAWNLSVYYED